MAEDETDKITRHADIARFRIEISPFQHHVTAREPLLPFSTAAPFARLRQHSLDHFPLPASNLRHTHPFHPCANPINQPIEPRMIVQTVTPPTLPFLSFPTNVSRRLSRILDSLGTHPRPATAFSFPASYFRRRLSVSLLASNVLYHTKSSPSSKLPGVNISSVSCPFFAWAGDLCFFLSLTDR